MNPAGRLQIWGQDGPSDAREGFPLDLQVQLHLRISGKTLKQEVLGSRAYGFKAGL